MFRETVLAAALAGIVASLLLTVLQFVWVTPLILRAETYEDRAEAPEHSHEAAPGVDHRDQRSAKCRKHKT